MTIRFKCRKCGCDEASIVDEIQTDTDVDTYSEIWKCYKCGEYHKVYYRRIKIVPLKEVDEYGNKDN